MWAGQTDKQDLLLFCRQLLCLVTSAASFSFSHSQVYDLVFEGLQSIQINIPLNGSKLGK